MTGIETVTLEVPDAAAAEAFYKAAFGLGDTVQVHESDEPTTGFRGFTLSLVVSQPSTVDSLVGTALDAGATTLKPVTKSFWGYGGVVQRRRLRVRFRGLAHRVSICRAGRLARSDRLQTVRPGLSGPGSARVRCRRGR